MMKLRKQMSRLSLKLNIVSELHKLLKLYRYDCNIETKLASRFLSSFNIMERSIP